MGASENCRQCGESLERLLIFAALKDLGCFVSGGSELCHDGKQHDFRPASTTTTEAQP